LQSRKVSDRLLELQSHWKPIYESQKLDEKRKDGPSKYILSMFPYPSGSLHMGHMRVYTISDVTARYFRLNGYDVIHPIGWDAFGLPAENAARERGVDPRQWTLYNIESMRSQLLKTGILFDWDREISTCDPSYYRWTQWIFLRLHEHGLLRRNLAEVNWDPVDNTVLAAEQIDSEGRSWRSGAIAEKRKLRQWMVETPRYAKRLSDGLQKLSNWHEVADIQSNWIGKCDVYRFLFPLRDDKHQPMEELLDLRVEDPVNVARATFIVIRHGHPLSDHERSSVDSPYCLGVSVLNGISGVWMPVIVVPENYDGPPMHLNARCGDLTADRPLLEQFKIARDQRALMPMNLNDVQEIAKFGNFGGYMTSRTLQDWVVSRQRAWGTPIPVILSPDGKTAVPLADNQLPLLQGQEAGRKVACDRLEGGEGYYETDTYYLRYLDPKNQNALLSREAATKMPVDIYVGGIEHAAVHMFFARFISYFLTDIGVTQVHEPFRDLIPQGIVRGKTFIDTEGRYVPRSDVVTEGNDYVSKDGSKLSMSFEKMSKSKGNGVDPLDVLEKVGVDMARLQLLDTAAPRQAINWEESDLKGLKKWIDRVAWVVSAYIEVRKRTVEKSLEVSTTTSTMEEHLRECYNYFVRNASVCLEVFNLHNTALARLQGLTNALRKIDPSVLGSSPEAERCIFALVTMMQVYTPYLAAELWAALQSVPPIRAEITTSSRLDDVPWPQVDPDCDIDLILIVRYLLCPLCKEKKEISWLSKEERRKVMRMVNDIVCGRIEAPRKEIEHLSMEELIARAKSVEHHDMFESLEKNGFTFKSITRTAREGELEK
uniref:leucine--tRNA ligase n=1 Tax=Haemonchus placei TaxID=6290 RepID=A0A0N4W935_HAEPC